MPIINLIGEILKLFIKFFSFLSKTFIRRKAFVTSKIVKLFFIMKNYEISKQIINFVKKWTVEIHRLLSLLYTISNKKRVSISNGLTAIFLIILIIVLPLSPLFNANAATFTTTWTTQSDFESNNVSGEGATTITNASTTASAGDVTLDLQGAETSFTDTFDNTTYKDSGSTAVWTGDGGISVPSASSTDLKTKTMELYGMTEDLLSSVYSTSTGMVYLGYQDALFIEYNPSTGTSTDLSSKISSFWASTADINAMTLDSTNNIIYFGGTDSEFASYNPSTETATDLRAKISSFWGVQDIFSLTFDSTNSVVYIAGQLGEFTSYNPSTATATDLRAKISSFWSTNYIKSMTFDSTNSTVYIGGQSGNFASYDTSVASSTDLAAKISSFWGGTLVEAISFDSTNNIIYFGGSSRGFASYNPSTATATDLEAKITSFWTSTSYVYDITFDSTNNIIYLAGGSEFASYNPSTETATDLFSKFTWGGTTLYTSTFDSNNNIIYIGGLNNEFASYNPSTATASNLSSAVISSYGKSTFDWYTSVFDSTNNILYLGGDDRNFASYDPSTGTLTDLEAKISSFWSSNKSPYSMTFDSTNSIIYLIGTGGNEFASYDPSTATATDLTAKISFWGAVLPYSMTFDSTNNIIYFAGSSGQFASYDPSTATATDLTSKISSFWSTSIVYSLTFDSTNNIVYLGGLNGKFASYDPSTATATDLTSKISSFWSTGTVASTAFDSANNIIYIGGYNRSFASYDPSTATATDLEAKITSFWYSSQDIDTMIFDSSNNIIYMGGESDEFASYNPSTAVATDLLSATTFDWGFQYINSLSFDPTNSIVYAVGWWGTLSAIEVFASGNAESTIIDSLSTGIAYATLTGSDTPGTGSVTYSMSNDNGTTWAEVTSGSQYTFTTASSSLKWKAVLTGDATIESVSITYNGYSSTGNITSLKEDAGGDSQWTNIAWTETTPLNTLIKFRTRGATNAEGSGALSSASWSPWYTASSTITDESSVANPTYRYIEVEMYLDASTDDGAVTPTLHDFTLTYVQNGTPDFNNDYPTTGDGGSTSTQNSTIDDADWGQVEISYAVRDTDSTSGDTTPGYVTPSFEYDIGAGWVTATGFASGDTDNKAVDESTYTTYTATWDAPTQLAGTYSASTSIRVTVNDNESLNNTASTSTAPFELDAKIPTITTATFNSRTDKVNLNLSDDTNVSYRLSNNSDLSADGLNASSGTWQAVGGTSTSTALNWTADSSETVYLEVRDVYNNQNTRTMVAPTAPTTMDIKDISNVSNGSYREWISWAPYTSTSSATFSNYTIYRSTDNSSFSSLGTISDVAVNYYTDSSLSASTTYYYKVVVVDTDSDTSSYSATVSDAPDGQGGTDVTAPTISSVSTANAQATWAQITWTTDEISNSTIEYSTVAAGDYGSSASSVSYVTSHDVTITGLTPATDYIYRVKSTDVASNLQTADNSGSGYTFTSASGPSISDVVTESINDASADIIWNTDSDSDSYVVYSDTLSDVQNDTNTTETGTATLVGGSGPTYQHRVSITGLTARTTYYYYVKSTDGSSNTVTDKNGGSYYSFTTTYDDVPPVISNISTPVKTAGVVVVIWQTDELADARIVYGSTSGSLDTYTTIDSTLSISHTGTISNLSADGTYYYQVISGDAEGNRATSSEQTATTTSALEVQYVSSGGWASTDDNTSPVISNVEVTNIGAFSATVTFTTNEDADGFVDYGDTTNYGKTAGSVSYKTKHSINIHGLKLGTKYFVKVKANDKSGNTGVADEVSFTTLFASENLDNLVNLDNAEIFQDQLDNVIESILPSLVPPFLSNITVTDITENKAKVTWETNVPTFGGLAYATDIEYDALNENPYKVELGSLDKGKTKNHSIDLSNLSPRTQYHIQAKSFVFPGVLGKSEDISFFTKASKISPEISKLTNTELEIRWITDVPTSSYIELLNTKTGQTTQTNNTSLVKNHSISVDNLVPSTTYSVRVFGYDSFNNLVEGDSITIRTKTDTIAPVISSIKISNAIVPGNVEKLQTVISWKTDENSNSLVYFEQGVGTEDVVVNETGQELDSTLNHTVILTALRPETVYRLKIVSVDSAGNKAESPVRTILTPHSDKSIVDIIFNNFQESFGFLENI